MKQITGTRLQDEILTLTALSVFADKETLSLLNTKRYVENTFSKMKADGLILERESKPKMVRLKKKGLELIRSRNSELYEHYMRHSGNNNPGMTQAHMQLYRKSSQVLTLMYLAGVGIGTDNPQLWQIQNGERDKNDVQASTFYCGKELVYDSQQKFSRTRQSRSVGQLISPGIKALVYNAVDSEMRFSKVVETEAIIRMGVTCQELYSNLQREPVSNSIVFAENDGLIINAVNRALTEKRKKSAQSWLLGDAIVDRNLLDVDIRYVNTSAAGIRSLEVITTFTEEECKQLCFSQNDREAVPLNQRVDAIVGELSCFEFLSANITKLAFVKRYYGDRLSQVGIACSSSQRDFVMRFFGSNELHMRVINDAALTNIIKERRSLRANTIAENMAE